MAKWVGIIFVLLFWAPAFADQTPVNRTVQTLYEDCKPASGDRVSFCLGYLMAFADIMIINHAVVGTLKDPATAAADYLRANSICGVFKASALRQAFLNWAAEHPERWQDDQAIGAYSALAEAWPCH